VVAAAGNAASRSSTSLLAAQSRGRGRHRRKQARASYSNTGSALDLVARAATASATTTETARPTAIWQQMPDPELTALGRYDQFCYCGLDGPAWRLRHVDRRGGSFFSQGFDDVESVEAALQRTASDSAAMRRTAATTADGFGLARPARALAGMVSIAVRQTSPASGS